MVRAEDGELRAFANVCRHRGSILVDEERGCPEISACKYHAWTYGLDGWLRSRPGSADDAISMPSPSRYSAATASLGPFILRESDDSSGIRISTEAIGDLPRLIAATGLDLDGLRPRMRRRFEIKANWRSWSTTISSVYRLSGFAHPGFCDVIDVKKYTVTEYEVLSTQSAPARSRSALNRSMRDQTEQFDQPADLSTLDTAGVDEGF